MKKTVIFVLCALMMLGAFHALAADEKPVVINNNSRETTYVKAPERAVCLSYNTAEFLAALGLEDKVVATAPGMYEIEDVLPAYRKAVESMPLMKEGLTKGTPNLETVLSYEPDFVIGTYYNFMPVNCGAPEDYEKIGAGTYATEGTYVEGATLQNTYNDILNLGRIFHVEDRAEALVAQMKADAEEIAAKVKSSEPVRTFVYDSGEGKLYSIGGMALENELLTLGGGKNVFENEKKHYFATSLEAVIDANPQAIIVLEYKVNGDTQGKLNYLKGQNELKDVDAIKNDRFILVSSASVFPSVQNVEAIKNIAAGLHPELFAENK